MDGLKNQENWFAELGSLWPGQALCLQYDKVLYHERSLYQDVLVLKTVIFFLLFWLFQLSLMFSKATLRHCFGFGRCDSGDST